MNDTTYKPYTISELIDDIYYDNIAHFDDKDTSDDCDCHIHTTIKTIVKYWDE